MNLFRKSLSSQVEIGAGVFVRGNILERLSLPAPDIEPRGGASIGFTARRSEKERNDTAGIGEGERFQQNGIDDGKNCGGSADAEGERRQWGGGERRIFAQHSKRVPQIRWQDARSPIFSRRGLTREGGFCERVCGIKVEAEAIHQENGWNL